VRTDYLGFVLKYFSNTSLLGLLAKIKCSICSYQFNILDLNWDKNQDKI